MHASTPVPTPLGSSPRSERRPLSIQRSGTDRHPHPQRSEDRGEVSTIALCDIGGYTSHRFQCTDAGGDRARWKQGPGTGPDATARRNDARTVRSPGIDAKRRYRPRPGVALSPTHDDETVGHVHAGLSPEGHPGPLGLAAAGSRACGRVGGPHGEGRRKAWRGSATGPAPREAELTALALNARLGTRDPGQYLIWLWRTTKEILSTPGVSGC